MYTTEFKAPLTCVEFEGLGAIFHNNTLPGITHILSHSGKGISSGSSELPVYNVV